MRLKLLVDGPCRILSPVTDNDEAVVSLDLADLDRPAPRAGFVVLLERCAANGPHSLHYGLSHAVGGEIREFIKEPYRLLYFIDDEGRAVVCSHIFRKQSRKTPGKERARAERLRQTYLEARADGTLVILEEKQHD